MPGSFDERFAAAREQAEKMMQHGAKRRDPEEREKLLRRAHEIVSESAAHAVRIGSPEVLAVARFLAGEPG